jgi:hypothetical protein
MIKWDFEIATLTWLLSMVAAVVLLSLDATPFSIFAAMLVGATTINLWHQRRTAFNAGDELERRVRAILTDDITARNGSLLEVERDVRDIKESQVRIAGSFRGGNRP